MTINFGCVKSGQSANIWLSINALTGVRPLSQIVFNW
jgi:hypothetical protein